MKFRLLVILLLYLSFSGFSQTTKVQGVVTDSLTNEPIPFAKIFFLNGRSGTLSDTSGNYVLLARPEWDTLIFSFVGYKTQKVAINHEREETINIQLVPVIKSFNEVEIVAGENPAFEILRKVKEHKKENNTEKLESYECEVYNKMQFDVNKLGDKFEDRKAFNKMKVINDYVEVDSSNDIKSLPFLLTENISDYYFKKSPIQRKEVIKANRITGVDYLQLQQFTGDMSISMKTMLIYSIRIL